MSKFVLFTDGGARGNPGPAAIGLVLEKDGQVIERHGIVIGEATNNVAEYCALVVGLYLAQKHGAKELACVSDSQLMVRQMKDEYKVRAEHLQPLHLLASEFVSGIEKVSFTDVRRENPGIARADSLVNGALDMHAGPVKKFVVSYLSEILETL
jgi:ribonuclease HI